MCPACRMYVYLQLLVLFHLVVVTDCQSISASAEECFDTSTCPCCKAACSSDGTGQCGGNCLDGYHGGKCWNECPRNCVRCVDVPYLNFVANCTQCRNGHYSTPTQYQCQLSCPSDCRTCDSATQCTSCRNGYYLTGANRCVRCNDTCLICNSATYCTGCKPGYYKELDTGTCRNCPYGCINEICTYGNGACRFGCKMNFTASPLGTCDRCIDGMYGNQCNISCSRNCESMCDRISGVCIACRQGFHGNFCDRSCSENCVLTCNRTTGNCDACMEGYHGNTCTLECQANCQECTITNGTCTTCVDGFYGDTCNKNCSEHCIINKCDKINGSCVCVPGYEGVTCQQRVTTTTTPRFSRDGLPLVVTPNPENYVGEAIGITLAGVVVLAVVIGGAMVLYRRRKRNVLTASLPVMSFKAGTSGEAKLKAELESLDQKMAKLDAKAAAIRERRADVEAQLQEVDRQMPYRHTDRADVIKDDNAYEMLQQQKRDEQGQYMSIKY